MNTLRESCHQKTNLLHVASATAKELYYYVLWTGHFICKTDFYIKRSHLDNYLLLYTVAGTGTLNYEGKSYPMKKISLC